MQCLYSHLVSCRSCSISFSSRPTDSTSISRSMGISAMSGDSPSSDGSSSALSEQNMFVYLRHTKTIGTAIVPIKVPLNNYKSQSLISEQLRTFHVNRSQFSTVFKGLVVLTTHKSGNLAICVLIRQMDKSHHYNFLILVAVHTCGYFTNLMLASFTYNVSFFSAMSMDEVS